MFNSGLRESSEEKVKLVGVDSSAFKLVIDYLYSGAIEYRCEEVSFWMFLHLKISKSY